MCDKILDNQRLPRSTFSKVLIFDGAAENRKRKVDEHKVEETFSIKIIKIMVSTPGSFLTLVRFLHFLGIVDADLHARVFPGRWVLFNSYCFHMALVKCDITSH